MMLVIELRPEQESERDILVHRRNVTDTPQWRIVKRIVDSVVIEELVSSRHRLSCHLAQLCAYPPRILRIVRKKYFHNVGHRKVNSRLPSTSHEGRLALF